MKVILLLCFITSLIPFRSYSQCDQIVYNKDKFTDVETWHTPIYLDVPSKQKIHKHVMTIGKRIASPVILFYSKDSSGYQISLTMYGEESPLVNKGIYIIFSNGEKLQYPDSPYSIDYVGYRVSQVAILKISESEATLFKNNTITDIRIGISDTEIDTWIGEKMKEQFNCLMGKIK